MITTTTIGAYPKPGYVPVSDWFSMEEHDGEPMDYRHRIRGTIDTVLPAIRGDVTFSASPLVRDFELAQSLSTKPVKVTLPGPMTFTDTTVILGVVAIAHREVEASDQIAARLRAALNHPPSERVVAAPDCGLGFLGRDLARKKLKAMTDAVAQVNATL